MFIYRKGDVDKIVEIAKTAGDSEMIDGLFLELSYDLILSDQGSYRALQIR